MSGKWSQERACEVFGVCDGRTISDLGGEKISAITGGLISPEVGKDVLHLLLFVGAVYGASKVLGAVGKGARSY